MPRDPALAAPIEAARRRSNVDSARLVSRLLLVVHLVCFVVFLLLDDIPHQGWRRGLLVLHGVGVAFNLSLAILTRGAEPRPLAARHAGEALLIFAVSFGVAVTLNSLQANFTLTPWLICSLLGTLLTHSRVGLALPLHLSALFLAFGACVAATGEIGARTGLLINAGAFGALGFIFSRVTFASFVRERLARLAVERTNAELERRVDAQIGDLVGKAERIEALNRLLAVQVQTRSAELSVALERLLLVEHGADPWHVGRVVGHRFEIRRLLGVGGMGAVYAAYDRVGDVEVALKVINRADSPEDGVQRFLDEANTAASLGHPAVVRTIHVDVSEEGELFQVQELVDGVPLDAWTTPGQMLPPPIVARVGAVLAEALAEAHALGIVHRDVKPHNIMLTRDRPGCRLLDFGLAKRLQEGHGHHTERGRVIGTPQFLAPEQVSTPDAVSGPADVYALGLTLYLALAGRLPFRAEAPMEWLRAHAQDPPRELLPEEAPAELAAVIMACLVKQPGERPAASTVASLLSAQSHGEVSLERWVAEVSESRTRELTHVTITGRWNQPTAS